MKLTEERKAIARAIWNIRREDEDRCDIELEDLGRDHSVWREADAAIAALPKPEPVGHYMGEHKDGSDCVYLYRDIKKNQMLYTEAPIAPPASKQKPIAWVTTNEDGDYAMLFFDQQEARRYSGDDEPVGLAPVPSIAPQPDYKTQRDAESQAAKDVLAERHRQQSVEGWTPEHDDQHENGELALAATAYAFNSVRSHQSPPHWWPWAPEWWKPTTARRDLVKAAALILARVEQIDRAAIASVKGGA